MQNHSGWSFKITNFCTASLFLSIILACGNQVPAEKESLVSEDATTPQIKPVAQPSSSNSVTNGGVIISSPTKETTQMPPNKPVQASENELNLSFTIDGLVAGTLNTNTNQIAIVGTCQDLSEVIIKTHMDQPLISKATCLENRFELLVNKEAEGLTKLYAYAAFEEKTSEIQELFVNFDSLTPETVKITEPIQNPLLTSVSKINLKGSCELQATVSITSQASTQVTLCDQAGIYSFELTAIEFGTFDFELTQKDLSGNLSPVTLFSWHYSAEIPAAPSLNLPATPSVLTATRALSLAGSCIPQHFLILSGDVLTNEIHPSPLIECKENGSFNYEIAKQSDGDFTLQLAQQNPASQMTSSLITVKWQVDTQPPEKIVLSTPKTNPYTSAEETVNITGDCELSAEVILDGPSVQSTSCLDGNFSFQVSEKLDGVYIYSLKQVDPAGHGSEPVILEWTKDTSIPLPPAIVQPANNPYVSASEVLLLSGSCISGHAIELTHAFAGEEVSKLAIKETAVCTNEGFSFELKNPSLSVNQTYELQLVQIAETVMVSNPVIFRWSIDQEAPKVELLNVPTNPAFSKNAVFEFKISEAAAQAECKIDSLSWSHCQSPVSYENLANGKHEFAVKARDPVGNESTIISYGWFQQSNAATALFHFNSSGGSLTDSSLYATEKVMNSGSSAVSSGKFSQGIYFSKVGNHLSLPHQAYFDQHAKEMTLEAWIRPQSLSRGEKQLILSKSGAKGISYEWFIQRMDSDKNRIQFGFSASLDGIKITTILSNELTYNTRTWYHTAATWKSGQVVFFVNGTLGGSGTIGTVGQAVIHATTDNVMIGNNYAGSNPLQSYLDELRVSNIVRYSTNFTVPKAAFVAD